MRKIILILLFVLPAFTLWGQTDYFNTIEFQNNTSAEIIYLFFSPLGQRVLGARCAW